MELFIFLKSEVMSIDLMEASEIIPCTKEAKESIIHKPNNNE